MRYARLNSTLWTGSAKWRKVQAQCPGDYLDPRLLYFYLHTCPHRNSIPCYYIPLAYLEADLKSNIDAIFIALQILEKNALVTYSHEECIVYLNKAIEQDPPCNIQHAKQLLNDLQKDIPDCDAKSVCERELYQYLSSQPLEDLESLDSAWQQLYRQYLQSDEWKEKRQPAMAAHNGLCLICNNRPNARVHHLTYDRVKIVDGKLETTELPEDLIGVCEECHNEIHGRM